MMMRVISVVFVLYTAHVLGYHDPDLNYHINQLQTLQNGGNNGYHYPAPALQLTTSGVKLVGSNAISQAYAAPSYTYSQGLGYQSNIAYQPNVAYQPPANNYVQTGIIGNTIPSGYAQKEVHGYSTSAGLSSYTGAPRTITPQATYAQAPIIAKITAAPLIAKYATSSAKTSFVNQNVIASHVEDAFNPVVSQVYAAPSVRYAVSPDLRVQNQLASNYIAPVPRTPGPQYQSSTLSQYPQTFGQFVPPPPAQFAAPVPQTYAAPAIATSQALPQYTSISQGVFNQYSAPLVNQIPVQQYSGLASHASSGGHVAKNVHTEFLENYDANPQYAYSYQVHDPHTGDIKQQREQRDGEVVKGQYSLVEPDGSVRTVDYVADWQTGFHAKVHNSKQQAH